MRGGGGVGVSGPICVKLYIVKCGCGFRGGFRGLGSGVMTGLELGNLLACFQYELRTLKRININQLMQKSYFSKAEI